MPLPPLTAIEALELWRRAAVDVVRSDAPDLTARQLAVLLNVYLTNPPHTVRGLAEQLKVAKPAITRAVTRLAILGLAKRQPDPADRRSVLVQRTVKGSVYLTNYGEIVQASAERFRVEQTG